MKPLICELCGSNDLLKTGGVFVCQHCGGKYSPEEAQKLVLEGPVDVSGSTVILDHSQTAASLVLRARQYKVEGNTQKAIEYLNKVLDIDANNKEAAEELEKIRTFRQEEQKNQSKHLKNTIAPILFASVVLLLVFLLLSFSV